MKMIFTLLMFGGLSESLYAMQRADDMRLDQKLAKCIHFSDYQELAVQLPESSYKDVMLFTDEPGKEMQSFQLHLLLGVKWGLIQESLWNGYMHVFFRQNEHSRQGLIGLGNVCKIMGDLLNQLLSGPTIEEFDSEFERQLFACDTIEDYKVLQPALSNEQIFLKYFNEIAKNASNNPERNFRFLILFLLGMDVPITPITGLIQMLKCSNKNNASFIYVTEVLMPYYQFLAKLLQDRIAQTTQGKLFSYKQGLPNELNEMIMFATLTSMLDDARNYADFEKILKLRVINRTAQGLFDDCVNNYQRYFNGEDKKLALKWEILKMVLNNHCEPAIELLSELINCYCDALENVDAVRGTGYTALMRAMEYNHPEIVIRLLELGANPCLRDQHGDSALEIGVEEGSLEALEIFLEFIKKHLDPVVYTHFINSHDDDFLQWAYQTKGREFLRLLINAGFNVYKHDEETSVFMLACERQDLEAVMMLAELGIPLGVENEVLIESLSVFHLSCTEYLFSKLCARYPSFFDDLYGEFFYFLVSLGEGDRLSTEIHAIKLALVRKAIEMHIDLYHVNKLDSALSKAILLKDKELIRLLLEAGMDIHRVNPDYCYELALDTKDDEIVAMIHQVLKKEKRGLERDVHDEQQLRPSKRSRDA